MVKRWVMVVKMYFEMYPDLAHVGRVIFDCRLDRHHHERDHLCILCV
jgi:hypothetical protein